MPQCQFVNPFMTEVPKRVNVTDMNILKGTLMQI